MRESNMQVGRMDVGMVDRRKSPHDRRCGPPTRRAYAPHDLAAYLRGQRKLMFGRRIAAHDRRKADA